MHITEYAHDGVLALRVSGRLNYYSRRVFQAVMKNAERSSVTHVVVNLEKVDYIDSVALGLLAMAQANLSVKGVAMSLTEPKKPVMEVLETANFPKLFPMYPTEEEAIGLSAHV